MSDPVTEYVVVQTQIVGSAERGFDFDSWEISRHRTLGAAKRSGLRLGHDDFNIAILTNGRLTRWTWMGEDTEPEATSEEEMDELAARLGWKR